MTSSFLTFIIITLATVVNSRYILPMELKMNSHQQPTSAAALLSRIEWILQTRELTQEKLCTQSGFSNRSQVSALIHRLRTDPDYPSKMSLLTYQKIARGGRVSLNWLLFGEGKPDQMQRKVETQFPNLDAALGLEGARWSESTIAQALVMPWKSDRTVMDWIKILDRLEAMVAQLMQNST